MRIHKVTNLSRRRFVTGLAGAGLVLSGAKISRSFASSAVVASQPRALAGNRFDLNIGYQAVNFTGAQSVATAINGGVPGPVLHWREGERVTLKVTNQLAEDTSIHWHGMILPADMDGVPGISFPGIKPGASYTYTFDVKQNGTYWYHSHSGMQEQTGHYGAIVIHARAPEPFACDRDYVVMLSDWTDEDPEDVHAKLKKLSHYYNIRQRTAVDLWRDIRDKGVANTWSERAMWNRMRMNDRDISDVTGYTYTFLMNGETPAAGWTGLFRPGERIRLRFINAAAMTLFDVRIPGLKMTVVAADGQYVQPVSVDDFRIGVAETYDVIVEPDGDTAYSVFAQAIDRSGYARGTLTPDAGLKADVPPMDPAPILTHGDMGMGHGAHGAVNNGALNNGALNNGAMDHQSAARGTAGGGEHSQHNGQQKPAATTTAGSGMDHSMHGGMKGDMNPGMNHGSQTTATDQMPGMDMFSGSGSAGYGSAAAIVHVPEEFGPHVDMRSVMPLYRLDDPGIGLRDHQSQYGRRVLTYADLRHLRNTPDPREPTREIQLHLTGNMGRYMWSFSGVNYADAEPLYLTYGERVRITLVNDTMMNHPIHLHGMWSDLEIGDGKHIPRKHTVVVQPGAKISYLVTADARGGWAYHCHLLYHMMGMFREVQVV